MIKLPAYFNYDVDGKFGDYLADPILDGVYDFKTAKNKLRELIAAFYSGAGSNKQD